MFQGFSLLSADHDWRLIALSAIVCLAASMVAIGLLCRALAIKRRTPNMMLDVAMNNMANGVLMFDASARLVVFNDRYLQMYGLTRELVKPGCTLLELLQIRIATGTFSSDPEDYRRDLLEALAERKAVHSTVELKDGRTIFIVHQPMAGGGWVATHEDVTEPRQREESFRLLFQSNPIPMWLYEQESLRFIAVNDAAVNHYGYSREQFLTMTLLDIRPPGDWTELRRLAATEGDAANNRTWVHLKADSTPIEVTIYRRSLRYQGVAASLVAAIDITDRKRAEDEVRSTREFLDTIIESVPVSVVVKDAKDLSYVLINRAAEQFFGVAREELIGRDIYSVFDKASADMISENERGVIETGLPSMFGDHPVETPRNGTRLVTTKKVAIPGADGKPQYLLTVIEDITERRQSEARIAHLAHHDSLTNLPNRAAFAEHLATTLKRTMAAGESSALLSLDLDRFKEINDVFGHAVGDGLLREVARRFQEAADGAFLSRLGGDEFTVIAGSADPEAAARLGDRLLATVAEDFDIDNHRLRIGISIGVAVCPNDGADAETILCNADTALYRAKADGRGTIRFFEADMDRRLRDRRALRQDLKLATTRGELLLHYQPQAMTGGDIVGFEALVRWQHPRRGLISPTIFIPLAEESGLIIPIGEWILREACREAASWPKPLQIAVNLSPIQFQHGDLPQLVHSILLETGLASARLELEVTEGVLIGDFGRAISILRRLKALGVRIAMDDFGTGYSSLSYLQSFPFDKIKIDQSFISNLEKNPQSAAIVRAVLGLGRGLDLPVLAEGVETDAQLAFLVNESCDEVQGYLIGRPGPVADYAALVGRQPVVEKMALAG